MDIASPITAVKGIGEKTQKAFAKIPNKIPVVSGEPVE